MTELPHGRIESQYLMTDSSLATPTNLVTGRFKFKIFISPSDCGVWTHPHFTQIYAPVASSKFENIDRASGHAQVLSLKNSPSTGDLWSTCVLFRRSLRLELTS